MTGTFTKKVIIKISSINNEGKAPLYIQVFVNKVRKQFPLRIYVPPASFDKKKQRLRPSAEKAKDYNLIIENELTKFTEVAVEYRLRNEYLTIDKLIKEINTGFSRINFIGYYENELQYQLDKGIIAKSSHKQQKSTLKKLKSFKNIIYFNEITDRFIEEFKAHLRIKHKNSENTVFTALKNFKKYLHLANNDGIKTPLTYDKITVRAIKGNRDFLEDYELKSLYALYKTKFLNEVYKNVLKKFLFSCFTGLRISDINSITQNNFVGDHLVFNSIKGNKFNKVEIIDAAKQFINANGPVFNDNYTEQCINKNLKEIAKICGIKKRITFHVARHTFATQYLVNGGGVEELKDLLGHEKIETTMIYVHIVKRHQSKNIRNLNSILSF
jgi:site-specific recombinase XerD